MALSPRDHSLTVMARKRTGPRWTCGRAESVSERLYRQNPSLVSYTEPAICTFVSAWAGREMGKMLSGL